MYHTVSSSLLSNRIELHICVYSYDQIVYVMALHLLYYCYMYTHVYATSFVSCYQYKICCIFLLCMHLFVLLSSFVTIVRIRLRLDNRYHR